MNPIKTGKYYVAAVVIFALVLVITGCAKRPDEKSIVASVNDCKMTLEDFNYEANEVFSVGRMLGEIPITKKDVLELLITREVLLQEAVREKLDRDKKFLKAIELYWEQTLLKNLLTKKLDEITDKTVVYDKEIIDYYSKMKDKIRAKIIVFSDERSAKKVIADKANALEMCQNDPKKYQVSYIIPSRWYTLGASQSDYETQVFNVPQSKSKSMVNINGKPAVIVVEEIAPNDIAPIEELKDDIRKKIAAVKEKEAIDKWSEELRKKARIKINEKILNSVN